MQTLTVERPWGKFEQFTQNEAVTVKIITINAGEAFSLQYHKKRTEFWQILSGNPEVLVGDKVILAKPGDKFEVPPETNHRIQARDSRTEILEIATGDFDEDDIVRLEDKYGRS